MPFIRTTVTEKISKDQETELKSRYGKAIEVIPGKDEKWLMCAFESETPMYFRGEGDRPMAFVEVMVYGSSAPESFGIMTGEICGILQEVLGVSPENVYVKYSAGTDWGWNGNNF